VRIVLTLLVRDEIDIISSNLEYHLNEGVDHIIVTDNGSQDGTRDVLARYQSGGRVTVLDERPSDFSQHRWVTRMARLACTEFGADWVINGDADEAFVWRRGSLREALERAPSNAHSLLASRTDFVPFGRPERRSPWIEMIYRKAVSLNLAGQVLPPKLLHRGVRDVVVEQGNHGAISSSFSGPPVLGEIEVFHYPARSLAQFESKVRNGGSGYARNRELDRGQGFHKRRWYDQLLRGELKQEFVERMFFNETRLRDALSSGELLIERTVAERLKALPALSIGTTASHR
jgi:glycosyltransferase involved in cell wall biosynthesis